MATRIQPLARPTRGRKHPEGGLLFAVYAPFGDDPVLSRYPGDAPRRAADHPLVEQLQAVAAQGVHVAALIDVADDCTQLVEIPALQPKRMTLTPAWKLDLSAPCTLAGFIERAHRRFPCAQWVLAMEGHGAGYLPQLDGAAVTPQSTNGSEGWQWIVEAGGARLRDDSGGIPVLPLGNPTPPLDMPALPAARLPLSTWGIGEGLRRALAAGVPAPLVIHFDNCFNLSLELMHTVAPHAGYATAYGNYNFFTAGETYPAVFAALRAAGAMSVEAFARSFGEHNHAFLAAKGNHPTLGGCVRLSRMKGIGAAVDTLATALADALDPLLPSRPATLDRIREAIRRAQQLDSDGDYGLEVPDQLTDLGSLAARLQDAFAGTPVGAAAGTLLLQLQGIWLYGDHERPWLDESQIWDFRSRELGLNVFLPDPELTGTWDWRSPYYLKGRPDDGRPPALAAQIGFLLDRGKDRAPWVRFLVEYHRDVAFDGYRRAVLPSFPTFNAKFEPKLPPPDDGKDGCGDPPPRKGGRRRKG